MRRFLDWLNDPENMLLHPVRFAALAHYKLVYIHPFTDGNGRTSRLLMNWILMQNGFPPVIIRKQDRLSYYQHLVTANDGGNFLEKKINFGMVWLWRFLNIINLQFFICICRYSPFCQIYSQMYSSNTRGLHLVNQR